MESLLANYASSDEEEQQQHSKPLVLKSETEEEQYFRSKSTSRLGEIFASLPAPKSSLFNSLPPPKSQLFPNPKPQTKYVLQDEQIGDQVRENSKPKASSSSLFLSLPQPKSSTSLSSSTTSKKVVQFRPPPMINPFSSGVNDEDEDVEERQRKKSKVSLSTSSAMSFLSSMPAPMNSATLGAMPSALGSGRRCVIESDARDSTEIVTGSDKVVNANAGFVNDISDEMNYDNSSWSLGSKSTTNYSAIESFHGENVASAVVSSVVIENDGEGVNSNLGSSEVKSDELGYDYSGRISGSESYSNHHNGGQFVSVGPEAVDYSYGNEDRSDYLNYAAGYGYYCNNPQDDNDRADTSIMIAFPEASGGVENALNYGKRGRKDAPQDIVEVKQDELMKNRPREDQTKMTGIAFGPAHQPISTKGKPSKLHKRKHQIGSLLFDMKQKETELAERRSRGYATKAQTQAKYGW